MNKLIRPGLKAPACLFSLLSSLTEKDEGGGLHPDTQAGSGVNWFNPLPTLLSSALCLDQKTQGLEVLQGAHLPTSIQDRALNFLGDGLLTPFNQTCQSFKMKKLLLERHGRWLGVVTGGQRVEGTPVTACYGWPVLICSGGCREQLEPGRNNTVL